MNSMNGRWGVNGRMTDRQVDRKGDRRSREERPGANFNHESQVYTRTHSRTHSGNDAQTDSIKPL